MTFKSESILIWKTVHQTRMDVWFGGAVGYMSCTQNPSRRLPQGTIFYKRCSSVKVWMLFLKK